MRPAPGAATRPEVDVLGPEPEALQQPEARAVEEAGHQPGGAVERGEDRPDLVPAQDGRRPFGPPGRGDPAQFLEGPTQDFAVEEQDGAGRLVLGRRRDIPLDGQVSEERLELGCPHLLRMAFPMEEDEAPDPLDLGVFGPDAVVQDADPLAHAVEELGHLRRGVLGRLIPIVGLRCRAIQVKISDGSG